jgi:hypothetical protein
MTNEHMSEITQARTSSGFLSLRRAPTNYERLRLILNQQRIRRAFLTRAYAGQREQLREENSLRI